LAGTHTGHPAGARCDYDALKRRRRQAPQPLERDLNQFQAAPSLLSCLVATGGECQVWLVPPGAEPFLVEPHGPARLLQTCVPE